MDSLDDDTLDEQYFRDANWVAQNGGYIHSNNGLFHLSPLSLSLFHGSLTPPRAGTVLFYFAQSPFFDGQSSNSSVFLQAAGDPRFAHWLSTRASFEAQLRRLAGIEYVVAYDPLALAVLVDNPTGGAGAREFSNVWVIRKQDRIRRAGVGADDEGGADQVVPLAYYYVVGDAIYQAPSVGKVIANRMVNHNRLLLFLS